MNYFFKEAFTILSSVNHDDRRPELLLRRKHIASVHFAQKIQKIAFDTRRIDQSTTYIPRRNLQNYHRSDSFIDKDASEKINTLFKVKTAVDSIREDYEGDPDWLDSYARILSCAVDRALRIEQQDFDYSRNHLNYLNELLYVRYRLDNDSIVRMAENEIRRTILGRDEKLVNKKIYSQYKSKRVVNADSEPVSSHREVIVKHEDPGESFLKSLIGEVKASGDNRNISRSITITINDAINDPIHKTSDVPKPEMAKNSDGKNEGISDAVEMPKE